MTENADLIRAAKMELERLVIALRAADAAYYERDDPILDDADYDHKRRQALKIVESFPELSALWPERDNVGGNPREDFEKVAHLRPMLSLNNAFNADDVSRFLERMRSFLNLQPDVSLDIFSEPKIDGLSLSLTYQNGMLVDAVTRGNGIIGERVLQNAKMIHDVPQKLRFVGGENPIEIRGEVYLNRHDFSRINKDLLDRGQKPFANPRNAAAGTIRQLKPEIVAERALSFMAYAIGQGGEQAIETQLELSAWLKEIGFQTNPLNKLCGDVHTLVDHHAEIAQLRPHLDYEIDGMVYKANDFRLQNRLGEGRRAPRWAIAHKFMAEKALSKILAIDIQVGRTGSLTPVARIEPVKLAGVTVTNINLHNEEEIARKDIRIGDTVEIQRAGDVIPQIIRSLPDDRPEYRREKFTFPNSCPVCGAPAIQLESETGSEVRRRCTNMTGCPAQIEVRLIHFVSKNGVDIDGFGAKQVSLFLQKGLIKKPSDIFSLKEHISNAGFPPLAQWEGFGKRSADLLFEAIETSRSKIDLAQFLTALSIRHIGKSNATLIAKNFVNWSNLKAYLKSYDIFPGEPEALQSKDLALQTLTQIDGIGTVQANAFIAFFATKFNMEEAERLAEILTPKPMQVDGVNHLFNGRKIVFTGTLSNISRQEAKAHAEKRGAVVSSTVSKKTDYVVVGAKAGTKAEKAKELDVQILTESAFLKLL